MLVFEVSVSCLRRILAFSLISSFLVAAVEQLERFARQIQEEEARKNPDADCLQRLRCKRQQAAEEWWEDIKTCEHHALGGSSNIAIAMRCSPRNL